MHERITTVRRGLVIGSLLLAGLRMFSDATGLPTVLQELPPQALVQMHHHDTQWAACGLSIVDAESPQHWADRGIGMLSDPSRCLRPPAFDTVGGS